MGWGLSGRAIWRRDSIVTKDAIVEVFWQAYGALKPAQRRTLAERILRDRKLLEDLSDHLLIEKAKRVRGKAINLDEYVAGVRKAC